MSVRPRTGTMSFGDFLEIVGEDQKADLLDGVMFMASPESLVHNKLVGWLYRLIAEYAENRGLGDVTVNKVAFRLDARQGPEPDVAFVAAARSLVVKPGYVDGPPDLAVEVVSPDSVDRDYERKRRIYETAGVREYWIIDPDEARFTFLRLDANSGRYVEVQPVDHIYRSAVLPGFWLDVRWLAQRPLPPILPIAQQLLR